MDPNTFLGSVGGMILRVKSLLRRCVDLYLGKYIYKYISKYGNCAKVDRIWMNIDVLRTIFI
jgi:hypothetical protein